MPVSLATNQQVIRELGERGSILFFPVSMKPLNECLLKDVEHGFVDENEKFNVVTNDDTGSILAVHKDKYRLQKNEDIFTAFDDALAQAPLDLSGLRVTDELAYSGGRAIRTYRMPAHQVDIGTPDRPDFVELMLKVQNSYDGSRRFGMTFGAFRLICSNGLVIGENMCEVRAKHTSGLDISAVTGSLGDAIEVFQQANGQWAQWRDTPCPLGVPESVIAGIPGISDTLRDRIFDYYTNDAAEWGRNLWVLYNALTRWSTHEPVKTDAQENYPALVLSREEKVRKALHHPVFGIAA